MWKILIVDDDKAARMLLRDQLEGKCICDEARNGAIAVEAYKMARKLNSGYDAILLDMSMVVMDGLECLKIIRESEKAESLSPEKCVPVIVVTGHEEYTKKCEDRDIDGFLLKPYNPYVLIKTIQDSINTRKSVSGKAA